MADTIHGPITRPYADTVYKTWNDPESAIFGSSNFGVAYYGDDSAGVFQRIHTKQGKKSRKLRYYVPTYSDSDPAKSIRLKFKNANLAWKALDPSEQNYYNILSKPSHMTGRNMFVKLYMLTN